MNPLLLLKGETLGKTIYNSLVFAAVLFLVVYVGFGMVSGKFWHWRADKANERADRAEAVAEVAQHNADNANGSAENAAITRSNMDQGKLTITVKTEQAAEKYDGATTVVDDDGSLDVDLVRDIQAARNRAGAAADRLQRTGTSRTAP